jgi:hypothetical protein
VSLTPALVLMNLPPRASLAQVDKERAWVKGLPFEMEGYFLLLLFRDNRCQMVVDIEWQGRPTPDVDKVQGALGVYDADARAEQVGDSIRVRSTWLTGAFVDPFRTYISIGGNNVQLVAYVHALISKVLQPIHRSHPIKRISVQAARTRT